MSSNGSSRIRSLRLRFGLLSAVLVLSATALSFVAIMLSTRFAQRFDVTATRQHKLSPRTLAVLNGLQDEHEILLVVDRTQVDPLIWQRISDVLDELDRASALLRITVIDMSDSSARAQVPGVFDRLEVLYSDQLENYVKTIRDAALAAESLIARMERIDESLRASAELMDPASPQYKSLQDQAARTRLLTTELTQRSTAALDYLDQTIGGSSLPAADQASAEIASLMSSLATDQQIVAEALEHFGRALEEEGNEAAGSILDLVTQLRAIRDIAARQSDAIERLGPLRVLTIARLLEQRSTVLALSATDATAVRFESLFPSQETVDAFGGTNADMLFAAEELLVTALQLLQEDSRYRVVLMHPFPKRLLDESGLPIPDARGLQVIGVVNRLQMRGIDVLEWPTTLDVDPPDSIVQIRQDSLPIVWVVTSIVGASQENAARLEQMRAQVEKLLDQGDAVLLCLSPSTIPSLGQPDPFDGMLGEFGVATGSGTPLLQEFSTAQGRVVRPTMTIRPIKGVHAITNALANLTTTLSWVVPLTRLEGGQASVEDVLTIPDSSDIWGESDWLSFWALPQSQREQLRNPPEPSAQDAFVDGPWTVSLASERTSPTGTGVQRLLVVGSSGWIFDGFTQRARTIDGRTVQMSPGNLELLDAGLAWLAQKDDLIAPGARVGDVPRIAAISATQLRTLRWGIVAGLPLLMLSCGVALRLIRG
jgi:hypothetical protein